jgi:hypothetical protein
MVLKLTAGGQLNHIFYITDWYASKYKDIIIRLVYKKRRNRCSIFLRSGLQFPKVSSRYSSVSTSTLIFNVHKYRKILCS